LSVSKKYAAVLSLGWPDTAFVKWNSFVLPGLCSALILSGCSTTKPGEVTYDTEAKATIVTGKATTFSPLVGAVRTVFLKAEISPGDTGLYLVVLYLSADGWLSVDQVWDSSGAKLQGFRGSDESFSVKFGQITKEIYYIPLTPRYLEAHRESGINLRLQGARGTLAATQPAAFVQGFLANLDATQKRVAGEVTVKNLIPEPPKSGSAF
jgi:hypothetical protein